MMAFFDGFVCSVIHNNKPLREFSDCGKRTVKIPFDSEYKLRLKSNGRRALVNVEIDGTDVLCGKQLILNWHDTIDLERFVDSFSSGKKFKFVPLSNSQVQDPTSSENGKIRITFHPEKVVYNTFLSTNVSCDPSSLIWGASAAGETPRGDFTYTASVGPQLNANLGATVEGGDSSQQFSQGVGFETDSPIVMEIWMRGTAQEEVVNPRYVVRIQESSQPQLWLEKPYRAVQNAQIQTIDGGLMKFKIGPTEFTTKDFIVKYE